MAFRKRKLLLIVFFVTVHLAKSVVYENTVSCEWNKSIKGYNSTTALNKDIRAHMQFVEDGNKAPDVFHYILCPKTEFKIDKSIGVHVPNGEDPIIPGLSNSLFTCGPDGLSSDDCVISGGSYHFYFADFKIAEQVKLKGITFSAVSGTSIYGDAHPTSHITFEDCHWMVSLRVHHSCIIHT